MGLQGSPVRIRPSRLREGLTPTRLIALWEFFFLDGVQYVSAVIGGDFLAWCWLGGSGAAHQAWSLRSGTGSGAAEGASGARRGDTPRPWGSPMGAERSRLPLSAFYYPMQLRCCCTSKLILGSGAVGDDTSSSSQILEGLNESIDLRRRVVHVRRYANRVVTIPLMLIEMHRS
jgi:hypothetical protein